MNLRFGVPLRARGDFEREAERGRSFDREASRGFLRSNDTERFLDPPPLEDPRLEALLGLMCLRGHLSLVCWSLPHIAQKFSGNVICFQSHPRPFRQPRDGSVKNRQTVALFGLSEAFRGLWDLPPLSEEREDLRI